MSAMTNFKGRLMVWAPAGSETTVSEKWKMVCPTKGNPALGGTPELIDASTNEDAVTVNIPGRQSLDSLEWTTNYDKTSFEAIKVYEDGEVHHFAQWFGENGNGEDGIFEFDGRLTAWVNEADSYGLLEATVQIGNTTVIDGPLSTPTDHSSDPVGDGD